MDEGLTRLIGEAMPLAAELGFEGVGGGPDALVVRGAWAPERCTAAGVLHGGYLMSLADVGGRHARVSQPPLGRHDHDDRGQDELPRGGARGLGDRPRRARPRRPEDDRRPG